MNFISGLSFKKIKTKQKNKSNPRKNCVLTNFIKYRINSQNERQNKHLLKSPKTNLFYNDKNDLFLDDSTSSCYSKQKNPSDILSLKIITPNIDLQNEKNFTERNNKNEENKVFLSKIEREYEIRCLKKKVQILKQKNFMLNHNITQIKKNNDKIENIINSEHDSTKIIICSLINIANINLNKNEQDPISSFKDLLFYLMDVKTEYENLLLNLNFFEGLNQVISLNNDNNNIEYDYIDILNIINNMIQTKIKIINDLNEYQSIESDKKYFTFMQNLFNILNITNFTNLFKYLQSIKYHNDNELKEITKIKNVLLTDSSSNIENIYTNPDLLKTDFSHSRDNFKSNYTTMNKFINENSLSGKIINHMNINRNKFQKVCSHSKTHKQISFNNRVLFPKVNRVFNDNSCLINKDNINNLNFFSQDKKQKTKNVIKDKLNFDKTYSMVTDFNFHRSSNNNIKIENDYTHEDIKINRDRTNNFNSASNDTKNKFKKMTNVNELFRNKSNIFNETESFYYDRSNLTERRENNLHTNRIIDEISNNYNNLIENKKKYLKIKTPTIKVNKINSVFSFKV